ncbi:DJ-1/PfpI family protein [Mesorhizobium sp. SB112]|uniref:DJ-1/PfpI family protein n=1 Tax=Mesorhizobium sp. SB112 TaxID=3151853 RepID=UPI003267AD32
MSDSAKKIGFVFINRYADWEYGLLAASAVEWFGAEAVALTPNGASVRSTAGFVLQAHRGIGVQENSDLDAVAVIGSDQWATEKAPDVSALLQAIAGKGGVIGGICAGTLALARAGIFEGVAHTSNGRDWIAGKEPNYRGFELYRDVSNAVSDRNIVSAPGSAPGTFAHAFLSVLYPERGDELSEMKRIFASEYAPAGKAS